METKFIPLPPLISHLLLFCSLCVSVPDAPLWAYYSIIRDPNLDRMTQYIQLGEKATWYKLCRLSNRFRLENMLAECSRALDAQARKQGLLPPPSRAMRQAHAHVNAGVTAADEARGVKDGSHDAATGAALPLEHEGEGQAESNGSAPSVSRRRDARVDPAAARDARAHLLPESSPSSPLSGGGLDEHEPEPEPLLLQTNADVETPTRSVSTTEALLQQEPLPMWKRGEATDTDVTDDERVENDD